MKIKLWAALMEDKLEAIVEGDVITINGEAIDLSGIPDGYRLPGSAVGNRFFVESEYVERIGKTLHFTLRLPVTTDTPEEYRNPTEPIILDARSGPVKLPDTSPPAVVIPEAIESGEKLEVTEDDRSIEA